MCYSVLSIELTGYIAAKASNCRPCLSCTEHIYQVYLQLVSSASLHGRVPDMDAELMQLG